MEHTIEAKVVLLAAEKIRRFGKREGDVYKLEQITFDQSYDGYTIILRDNKVSISLFFHNTIKCDYKSMGDLDSFYQRLERLCQYEPVAS